MSDDRNSTAPFFPPAMQQAQLSASQAALGEDSPKSDTHSTGKTCAPVDAPRSRERSAERHHASKDKDGDEDDEVDETPRDLRPVPAERDVYSVSAFCARHSIS